jgi:hypothetical protein
MTGDLALSGVDAGLKRFKITIVPVRPGVNICQDKDRESG